jgi:hypothetical protein
VQGVDRDRDPAGRPRNARPRDSLGRPLQRTAAGSPSYDEERALPPDAAVGRGWRLLGAGEAFRAHELFEAMWKAAADDERPLWRGLAQLAVGITHAQRGNATGAAALLTRAADTLSPFAGTTPHGVPVDRLRRWAATAAQHPTPELAAPPLHD